MNINEYLLVCLSEEAVEVSHAVSKALRFGLESKNLNSDTCNRRDIVKEFNDVIAIIELLEEAGISLPDIYSREHIEAKKNKIKQFMIYSEDSGCLRLR